MVTITFDGYLLIFCRFPFLTLSQLSPVFTYLQNKSFENTVEKGEIARGEQFLLFPQCFLPVWRTFCHFHHIKNCPLQTLSVWKSLKFVVLERVYPLPDDKILGLPKLEAFADNHLNVT